MRYTIRLYENPDDLEQETTVQRVKRRLNLFLKYGYTIKEISKAADIPIEALLPLFDKEYNSIDFNTLDAVCRIVGITMVDLLKEDVNYYMFTDKEA